MVDHSVLRHLVLCTGKQALADRTAVCFGRRKARICVNDDAMTPDNITGTLE